MEVIVFLKSLGHITETATAHVKEELISELKERFHSKARGRAGCSPSGNSFQYTQQDRNRLVEEIVAGLSCPASTPSRLSSIKEREILERVAEHPDVSSHALALLAESEHYQVRQAVSENPNTPYMTLETLVGDCHPDVRFRMAENPHLCMYLLQTLCHDENPYVGWRASRTMEMKLSELVVTTKNAA